MSILLTEARAPDGRVRVGTNVSLDPIEREALRRLADEEDRGVTSWFIQRLIDERMRSKIGSDWRTQLAAELSSDGDQPS